MSQDDKGQLIPKDIKGSGRNERWKYCPCGGEFYAAPNSRFAKCSNGEVRCTQCLRQAKKFGRGGLGCDADCSDIAEKMRGSDEQD